MQVKISNNIHDLIGIGEEWLLDKTGEFVICKFYNGNIIADYHVPPTNGNEITLISGG